MLNQDLSGPGIRSKSPTWMLQQQNHEFYQQQLAAYRSDIDRPMIDDLGSLIHALSEQLTTGLNCRLGNTEWIPEPLMISTSLQAYVNDMELPAAMSSAIRYVNPVTDFQEWPASKCMVATANVFGNNLARIICSDNTDVPSDQGQPSVTTVYDWNRHLISSEHRSGGRYLIAGSSDLSDFVRRSSIDSSTLSPTGIVSQVLTFENHPSTRAAEHPTTISELSPRLTLHECEQRSPKVPKSVSFVLGLNSHAQGDYVSSVSVASSSPSRASFAVPSSQIPYRKNGFISGRKKYKKSKNNIHTNPMTCAVSRSPDKCTLRTNCINGSTSTSVTDFKGNWPILESSGVPTIATVLSLLLRDDSFTASTQPSADSGTSHSLGVPLLDDRGCGSQEDLVDRVLNVHNKQLNVGRIHQKVPFLPPLLIDHGGGDPNDESRSVVAPHCYGEQFGMLGVSYKPAYTDCFTQTEVLFEDFDTRLNRKAASNPVFPGDSDVSGKSRSQLEVNQFLSAEKDNTLLMQNECISVYPINGSIPDSSSSTNHPGKESKYLNTASVSQGPCVLVGSPSLRSNESPECSNPSGGRYNFACSIARVSLNDNIVPKCVSENVVSSELLNGRCENPPECTTNPGVGGVPCSEVGIQVSPSLLSSYLAQRKPLPCDCLPLSSSAGTVDYTESKINGDVFKSPRIRRNTGTHPVIADSAASRCPDRAQPSPARSFTCDIQDTRELPPGLNSTCEGFLGAELASYPQSAYSVYNFLSSYISRSGDRTPSNIRGSILDFDITKYSHLTSSVDKTKETSDLIASGYRLVNLLPKKRHNVTPYAVAAAETEVSKSSNLNTDTTVGLRPGRSMPSDAAVVQADVEESVAHLRIRSQMNTGVGGPLKDSVQDASLSGTDVSLIRSVMCQEEITCAADSAIGQRIGGTDGNRTAVNEHCDTGVTPVTQSPKTHIQTLLDADCEAPFEGTRGSHNVPQSAKLFKTDAERNRVSPTPAPLCLYKEYDVSDSRTCNSSVSAASSQHAQLPLMFIADGAMLLPSAADPSRDRPAILHDEMSGRLEAGSFSRPQMQREPLSEAARRRRVVRFTGVPPCSETDSSRSSAADVSSSARDAPMSPSCVSPGAAYTKYKSQLDLAWGLLDDDC